MNQLSVSEARALLPEVLNRVAEGEQITITRHGRPVAVVVRPDALRVGRAAGSMADAVAIGALLDSAAGLPPGRAVVSPERADELVQAIRAGRDQS